MRQVALCVLQVVILAALWWFLRHIYIPAFGVIGALIWIAGCMGLGFWMDAQLPWRHAVAFTALVTLNFAAMLALLASWPDWRGMLACVPLLALGYRIAGTIEALTPSAPPRWTTGLKDTPPKPASTPAAARTNRRAGTRPRFGHR
jgi:hypothetical protein